MPGAPGLCWWRPGASLESVAERVGCSKRAVRLWRGRYEGQGIAGLADVPGRGRKPSLEAENVKAVLTRVVQPHDFP